MRNLIISVRDNILRISVAGVDEFIGFSKELPKDLDIAGLAGEINSLLQEQFGPRIKDFILHYSVEPDDVLLRFLTVDKSAENVKEVLQKEVEDKLKSEDLEVDDVYYSYQKIAPFVYQLVAVKRERLDQIVELSIALGYELKTASPWILMLPRLVSKSGEPCLFLVEKTLVLSELKGVYYSDSFGSKKSVDDVEEVISELLVYERSEPIETLYVKDIDFEPKTKKFKVTGLEVLDKYSDNEGFTSHAIIEQALLDEPEIFTTQANLLNVLPLPAEERSSSALAYVGAALGIGLIAVIVLGAYYVTSKKDDVPQQSEQASVIDQPKILSEETETQETTQAQEEKGGDHDESVEELAREDIVIRVENGTQIAGYAANTRTFLEGLGYTVDSIGDSEEDNEGGTVLRFKTSRLEYSDLLAGDLETDYSLDEIEQGLDDSLEYDVLIILGNE